MMTTVTKIAIRVTSAQVVGGTLPAVSDANYNSGDDYVVEFLGCSPVQRQDFEQRVTAAAVKLGLLDGNELDDDETADLVELAADGVIEEPRSALLGRWLIRHRERVSPSSTASRSSTGREAGLPRRVARPPGEGREAEVTWDDRSGDFGYRDPDGGRALLDLAPVPSWHEMQFRR